MGLGALGVLGVQGLGVEEFRVLGFGGFGLGGLGFRADAKISKVKGPFKGDIRAINGNILIFRQDGWTYLR